MPPVPDWKRALDTGVHFTEVRRSQARKLASDLAHVVERMKRARSRGNVRDYLDADTAFHEVARPGIVVMSGFCSTRRL